MNHVWEIMNFHWGYMGHYQKSVDFGVFQIKKKSSMKPKNIMATTLLWYCNVKTHYRSLCWRVQFFLI